MAPALKAHLSLRRSVPRAAPERQSEKLRWLNWAGVDFYCVANKSIRKSEMLSMADVLTVSELVRQYSIALRVSM